MWVCLCKKEKDERQAGNSHFFFKYKYPIWFACDQNAMDLYRCYCKY